MCDAMREPPLPGSDLFMYWHDKPYPTEGEERNLEVGEWMLRVRIERVKDAKYKDGFKHVSMLVIG